MCLDTVLPMPDLQKKVGWKVVEKRPATPATPATPTHNYVGLYRGAEYTTTWHVLGDHPNVAYSNDGSCYQLGFHIYTKIEDARKELEHQRMLATSCDDFLSARNVLIIEVEWDDPLAYGYDCGHAVIVTSKIRLVKEIQE